MDIYANKIKKHPKGCLVFIENNSSEIYKWTSIPLFIQNIEVNIIYIIWS